MTNSVLLSDVALWVCNDQQQTIVMSPYTVSNYGAEIIKRCGDSSMMVQGQVFDSDQDYKSQNVPNQFNVQLGKTTC
ncbi:hypothetical protein GGR57DRAFT_349830 [Xylariaceae sp. FL1272]|nr:hypothetical protein GGR57DRAFT_349830 [Xylariaceae sp. FL1272]